MSDERRKQIHQRANEHCLNLVESNGPLHLQSIFSAGAEWADVNPLNADLKWIAMLQKLQITTEALWKIKNGGLPPGVFGTVEDRMISMCEISGEALEKLK